jgi:branched-chain amino acid transport system permease protein
MPHSAFSVARLRDLLIGGACAALACAALLLATGYQLFQATMIMSYAIALMGLNLLTGYNGQISIGHGAFFAVGAYAASILIENGGVHYALAVPLAGGMCFVFGYLFGRPALKLAGLYLALATFALGVATPQILKYKLFEKWTGGVQGLFLEKPSAPFGLPLSPDQWLYLYALLLVLLMSWIVSNIVKSETGRVIRAIRDNPLASEAMGINIGHYKSVTFALSAAFAGLGGAISALAVQFVAPDSFGIFLSISLLVGIVVGGVGTFWGVFIGAAFIMFVPAFAEKLSKSAPWAIYGALLIGVMYFMPSGVAGALGRLRQRLRAR